MTNKKFTSSSTSTLLRLPQTASINETEVLQNRIITLELYSITFCTYVYIYNEEITPKRSKIIKIYT